MYLHIGNDINIMLKNIIAIINKESLESSKNNNQHIEDLLKDCYLVNENLDDVKTYIIAYENSDSRKQRNKNKKYSIYTSNISSITLLKRNKSIETRLEVNANGQRK